MQVNIYIQNKPVILTDNLDEKLEKLHHLPETIFIDELDTHSINTMLREISLAEIKQGIFLHNNFEELKKRFFKKFDTHIAGGGLVINENKEILMIFRRGAWDLPKGHLDKGESIEDCAIREVQEETGLKKVNIISPLTITYHTYQLGTHHILKESHWYLMEAKGNQLLKPQTEEDIEKIEWISFSTIQNYLKDAYPSICDVVNKYLQG